MDFQPTKMRAYYQKMSKRDQCVVFTLLAFFIFLLWYALVWHPTKIYFQSTQNALSAVRLEVQTLQDETTVLQARLKKDPNEEISQKQAKLYQDKQALQQKLNVYNTQLLSPQGLMQALQAVLNAQKNIHLSSIALLPNQGNLHPSATQSGKPLFAHGVKLQFTADYFSTLQYLRQLEQLRWRLFWDRLDYRVTDYPLAEVTLEIHTLSTEL